MISMLGDMKRHPIEPVEVMRLDHWWHERFSWYGPYGIGSSRGADQFRRFHQVPFLAAMPDREGGYKGDSHFFGKAARFGRTGSWSIYSTCGTSSESMFWPGCASSAPARRSPPKTTFSPTKNANLGVRKRLVLESPIGLRHQLPGNRAATASLGHGPRTGGALKCCDFRRRYL